MNHARSIDVYQLIGYCVGKLSSLVNYFISPINNMNHTRVIEEK